MNKLVACNNRECMFKNKCHTYTINFCSFNKNVNPQNPKKHKDCEYSDISWEVI